MYCSTYWSLKATPVHVHAHTIAQVSISLQPMPLMPDTMLATAQDHPLSVCTCGLITLITVH